MRGSDGKLCLSEKERGKVWKDYMKKKKLYFNNLLHFISIHFKIHDTVGH